MYIFSPDYGDWILPIVGPMSYVEPSWGVHGMVENLVVTTKNGQQVHFCNDSCGTSDLIPLFMGVDMNINLGFQDCQAHHLDQLLLGVLCACVYVHTAWIDNDDNNDELMI